MSRLLLIVLLACSIASAIGVVYMRHMHRLPHAAVHRGVIGVPVRAHTIQPRTRLRIQGREQGDVDPAYNQTFGQQAGHQLPRTVVQRRRAPRDRRQHRHVHWVALNLVSCLPATQCQPRGRMSAAGPNAFRRGRGCYRAAVERRNSNGRAHRYRSTDLVICASPFPAGATTPAAPIDGYDAAASRDDRTILREISTCRRPSP